MSLYDEPLFLRGVLTQKKVKRLSLLAYWLLCITQTGVEMVCVLTLPTISVVALYLKNCVHSRLVERKSSCEMNLWLGNLSRLGLQVVDYRGC